jgi:hypothetical protein
MIGIQYLKCVSQNWFYTGCIRNNVTHDLTLIKLIVTRFVGTGGSQLDILTVTRNKHIAR